ncbi:hypothetical protein HQ531_05260 [bacterium]|nr:hypothetical protein [bacterium]
MLLKGNSNRGYLGHILILVCALNIVQAAEPANALEVADDLKTVIICETGIQNLLSYTRDKSEVWGLGEKQVDLVLNWEEKKFLLNTWTSLLDYFAQLDHIQNTHNKAFYQDVWQVDNAAIYCSYLAFLTQYRYSLEFLNLIENNGNIHTWLNEAHPEFGLKKELYAQFKYHFLNVFLATKFVALDAIVEDVEPPSDFGYQAKIDSAEEYLYEMGLGGGTGMTFANGLKIMQESVFDLWLPLQEGVSRLMSGKKVWRMSSNLIAPDDIVEIGARLEPGDILFTRREWVLTNLGLPGFWTHTVLFLGTPEQRSAYFTDQETKQWVINQGVSTGSIEELLALNYQEAYEKNTAKANDGNVPRTIEALKEGVIFNSLETSLNCDGMAALRPRLSKREKAEAIFRAFGYSGRPYDFNFDFLTDSALVCSELVLKAYESSSGFQGINVQSVQIGQRIVTPCNVMIQQFNAEYGTPEQQLDFVLFYDGYEKRNKAISSSVEELRKSWTRPDWHIFLQD